MWCKPTVCSVANIGGGISFSFPHFLISSNFNFLLTFVVCHRIKYICISFDSHACMHANVHSNVWKKCSVHTFYKQYGLHLYGSRIKGIISDDD